jgi:hypothetical protein
MLSAGDTALQLAISLEIFLAVASIVTLLAGYVLIYERRIWRLDAEIKDLRALMLLLPDDVFELVPSFGAALLRVGVSSGAATPQNSSRMRG